jgi:predicted PurR-regulated permease PerM
MIFSKEQPFYMRLTFKLALVLLIGFLIHTEKVVLVPLYFSILLSILLLPLSNFLERLKFPKAIAGIISVLLALIFIAAIVWFLSSQLSVFLKDIPAIKSHINEHFITIQTWVEQKFNISTEQQSILINNARRGVNFPTGTYIERTFLTVSQTIVLIILVAIYSFLLLYYRHLIKKVIFALFSSGHQVKVHDTIQESKHVVQKYMVGLVIEMLIVATANSAVLLFIGIKYAIFLGVFAAILNIIPYIGIFTGMLFTVLVTLSTTASMHQIIWIVIAMEIIHFIDANFLMTRIVGSRVKINALMTIIGAVAGGALIGIPGIFLALPTIAILKIIFDRVEDLKPWGMLLGDETMPIPLIKRLKKITGNKKS